MKNARPNRLETPVSLLMKLREDPEESDWERFYELYAPIVYGATRRAKLSEADAADAVQDVFTQMLTYVPRFTYKGRGFGGLMWTIARNRCRMLGQRSRRAPRQAESGELRDMRATGDSFVTEQEFQAAAVRQAWERIRSEFNETTCRAFEMYAMEGIAAEDVAEQLGISRGQVYQVKSRITKRIRDQLNHLLD